MIGDVVGSPGRSILSKALPKVVRKYDVEYVVANVENAAHYRAAFQSSSKVSPCNALLLGVSLRSSP